MKTKEISRTKTKKKIYEVLAKNELSHIQIMYYGYDGFFIPIEDIGDEQLLHGIPITMCNKDICIVYPHEILFIAIEDRKSVLYLTNRKIETHYSINHWRNVLDEKFFAQPHYSYIVNLNYVHEVTKKFVKIKYANKEYSVYTSSRKIGAFKKAVFQFNKLEI